MNDAMLGYPAHLWDCCEGRHQLPAQLGLVGYGWSLNSELPRSLCADMAYTFACELCRAQTPRLRHRAAGSHYKTQHDVHKHELQAPHTVQLPSHDCHSISHTASPHLFVVADKVHCVLARSVMFRLKRVY